SGSMSLAFSGHTTRSGAGAWPARTWSARRTVAVTWLSSTARRWALKSNPSRGTLPWTIATVTVGPGGVVVAVRGTIPTPTVPATTASQATDHPHRIRRGVRGRPPASRATPAQPSAASTPPASATAAETSGAPPSAAKPSSGPSVWLNANRPQGNPPNGIRERSASCPTHSRLVASGQTAGHRSISGDRKAAAAPSTATKLACSPANNSQGRLPTWRLAQLSSGTNNARPASAPRRAPTRGRRRCTATASNATPTGAAHHWSYGGKATSWVAPAPTAASIAHGSGTGAAVGESTGPGAARSPPGAGCDTLAGATALSSTPPPCRTNLKSRCEPGHARRHEGRDPP